MKEINEKKSVQQLTKCTLQVRMAAGGALAIAHERITDPDSEVTTPQYIEVVLPRLEQLARDSHKYRAKRDRKLQRATFRDILKYFEVSSLFNNFFFLICTSTYRNRHFNYNATTQI